MNLLIALLEGLEVPNHEWWISQCPDALRVLGVAIASQAKGDTSETL